MFDINLQKIKRSYLLPEKQFARVPASWETDLLEMGHLFINRRGLRVICSLDEMESGNKYIHVSCSYPDRLPSWDDVRSVKDIFIGKEKYAIQVLSKENDYVNLMPFCLHLWAEN